MSDRRRRTMGEHGALPDPSRNIRYGLEEPAGDIPAWRQFRPAVPPTRQLNLWDRILSWFD